MADKKNRTNWSDKARRITGGVTLGVIILIILLCVLLGKKNKSVEPEPIVQPTPVVTEVKEEKKQEPVTVVKEEPKEEVPVIVEEVKEPEILVEEPVVPVVEEPIKEIIADEEPKYTTGEVSFDVCGITVKNSWSDGLFVSTSNAKERFSKEDVMAFVRYEADKYLSYMDEETVLKIIASTGTIKIEYPSTIAPEILMPYYKNDIEEYAALIAPVEEIVEEPVEEAVVEEPAIEEVVPMTADFTVFGYKVLNSWVPGTFTSVSETKGLLYESDVMGFAQYEIGKYGDFLLENVAIEFIPDGFVLTYPEAVDPSGYIAQYKSDIEEYVASLFAPVEVVEEPAIEEVVPMTSDFTVFGYKVLNSWVPGTFTSVSETKGLLYESDVMGFAQYEIGKYGDFLLENVAIEFIPDGFVLTYPEAVDPSGYIAQYKSDIEEYVATLFTAVEVVEEPAPVEEPAVEEPVVPTAPLEPVAVDVPKPAEVVEVVVSPKADKLSSYKFKLGVGFGSEFGINNKVDYVTIFPRLAFTADFQNVFTVSKVGFGARLDLSGVFKPLDGTFIGHEFKFFLNGNNWAVDAMIDAKLMAYVNLDKVQLYVGGGIGYSIGSHNLYMNTHTSDNMVFGFDTATALSAVVGLDWNISEKFSLTLEGNYRYFFQSPSKAQTFAATIGMGFKF